MRNPLVSSCVRAYQESDYESRSVYRDLHLVKDFDHDHHDLIEIANCIPVEHPEVHDYDRSVNEQNLLLHWHVLS
jgi:hypothetical protein